MKTLLINGTTKQNNSASGYLMRFMRLCLKGEKTMIKIRNKLDIPRVMSIVDEYDALLFIPPLYCDGVPANVLYFMQELEKHCIKENKTFKIYVLTNCGFIEGRQTEALFKVFHNFCIRANCEWCGGLGIGGGVMLNITKIMMFIWTILCAILTIYNGIEFGDWLPSDVRWFYLETLATVLFFNSAAYAYMFSLSISINNRRQHGIRFTRAVIFAWLFALIADVGFVIISMFRGGFWKGINRKL